MVKVSDSTVNGIINLDYTLPSTKVFSKDDTNKRFYLNLDVWNTYNSNITWKIISWTFDDNAGYISSQYTWRLSANWVSLWSHSSTGDITVNNSSDITLEPKWTLDFICTIDNNNYQYVSSWWYKVTELHFKVENQTISISKQIFTHKSLPRTIKDVWNECKSTLFWYHIDSTWFEW